MTGSFLKYVSPFFIIYDNIVARNNVQPILDLNKQKGKS